MKKETTKIDENVVKKDNICIHKILVESEFEGIVENKLKVFFFIHIEIILKLNGQPDR